MPEDGFQDAVDGLRICGLRDAQADHSLERSTMGLGVGLSLSRKLAELHGGTL